MRNVEPIRHVQLTPRTFAGKYFANLSKLFGRIELEEIDAFVQTLLDARARGAQIFFIGNGGSAATASHFANDLCVAPKSATRSFRAVSLTDNVALLTAIANDYGYAQVFKRQLEALMEPNDVVVAISASGNSPNVVEAIRWANAQGGVTVGLTGFDGGQVRALANVSLHVPTRGGEYGPVEDLHLILNHLIAKYLRLLCESEEKSAQ